MGTNGILAQQCIKSEGKKKRGFNAVDFNLFLQNHAHRLPANSVIILDNAKIHHAQAVQPMYTMLERAYGLSILFLPPYSPFMNAIEYAFAKLKEGVGVEKFSTRDELIGVIEREIRKISPQDAAGYISHITKYYSQASLGLAFRGKPLYPEIIGGDVGNASEPAPVPSISHPPSPTLPLTNSPSLPALPPPASSVGMFGQ